MLSLVNMGFTTIGSSRRSGVKGAGRVETNRWRGDERSEARGERCKGECSRGASWRGAERSGTEISREDGRSAEQSGAGIGKEDMDTYQVSGGEESKKQVIIIQVRILADTVLRGDKAIQRPSSILVC